MTLRAPEPRPNLSAIRKADKEYERIELSILQNCSPGYPYAPAADDERAIYAFGIMKAEGYLVEITEGYAITAVGRAYRNRLQRPRLLRWLIDHWHWAITTAVATASTIVAIAAVIVASD